MAGTEPTDVWPIAAELGEGPVWVERDRALWFVDIKRQQIHRYDPADGAKRSWPAPEQVGFVFPAERGGFVAGLQSGLYHFDEATGAFELIVAVESNLPTNRLNDGVVDPEGRLWFGTMDNGERAKSGAFYCFAGRELTRTPIEEIAITNGPAVSPDGLLLYVVDTLKGTIDRADIRNDGTLGERRPFVRIDPKHGHPDGPTIDAEGCVWIGLYAGWEAWR
jgi:sugar lactone lactonase YvrE